MIIRTKRLVEFLCLLLVFVVVDISEAKSVYAITKHQVSSIIKAYNINNDEIEYQGDVDASAYNPGNGAVGLCVWEDLELLFVTYETSDRVVWASTKTLEKINQKSTGASNLAGLVADENKEKLQETSFVYATTSGYCKSLISRAKAVLGFTPQAFDQAVNSVISTRLLAVSQL